MHISSIFRNSILMAVVTTAAIAAQARTPPVEPVSVPFTVDTRTSIPGNTLKPGTYSIQVVDHLSDRCILRIEDMRGHAIATFIGLPNASSVGSGVGAVQWAKGPDKKPALRGFGFGNGLTVEFVYPKEQAIELAKLNASSVPAIDPESEGRPAVPNKLSDEDRQLVTLWTLSSTRIGPNEGIPAIEAKRYRPERNTELAQSSVAPAPVLPAASTAPVASTSDARQIWSSEGAKMKRRAVSAKLPQTASDLPLVIVLSGVFLVTGLGVGAGRRFLARA